MKNGIKTRMLVHNILFNILKHNLNIDDEKFSRSLENYSQRDKNFIINICLTTMRRQFHINYIISKYVKKNNKIHQKILLMSAICQIIYLNFKEYAVIDTSVEIAKQLKLYHGFINSVLKKISKDKKYLSDIEIKYEVLPTWFRNEVDNLNKSKKNIFLSNFYKKPNLHIVFNSEIEFKKFEKKIVKTSQNSGFLQNDKINYFNLDSFNKGTWWVQDLSSFIPINSISSTLKDKKVLDMCAAPGGKSFQAIAANAKVFSNDKNKKRLKILRNNLVRLNFDAKILNMDATNLNINEKFDLVIIDAPCSGIGTIRRNPEILFKSEKPNIGKLNKIQKKLLSESKKHLNRDGYILYMVCSFLYSETISQINSFLVENENFNLIKLTTPKMLIDHFNINDYFLTLPSNYKGYNFDGYFAALMASKN